MIRLTGSLRRFCDGLTRRDLLHLGALTPLGLTLGTHQPGQAGDQSPGHLAGFGRAKRCILLCLWGSPSQIETLDPKPNAPVEVRGELGSIATAIPGVRLGEILPRTARILDRTCVLRSLTHPYPIHGVAFATTGVPTTDIPLETRSRDPRHWPFIGSVLDHLAEKKSGPARGVPRNFGLPFPFGARRGPARSGPFGGFLGPAFDPVWSDFQAEGIHTVERDAGTPGVPPRMVADPYLGIRPEDRFELAAGRSDLSLDRLDRRVSLVRQLERQQQWLDQAGAAGVFDRQQALALSVLNSGKLRKALDVQAEPAALRERYGMSLFGQSCLAARRVLEVGGTFVTVFWDEVGLFNTGWDTHVHHYPRLRDELGPGLDRAFSSLVLDLEARGMLDDTAVVVLSEHGRTPRLQNVKGGGRDHWSRAYSALFAGGGFARGRVVGRTDRIASDVAETAFSPKDVLATLYHLLGVDPHLEIHDRLGRPVPVGSTGRVRPELLV
ncbi:MAG: DUF1501 domain-containing protein [Gemmataceae bacterium]